MTSWMEERDRLVAQTQAFVQQVAAAHPKHAVRPEIEKILVEQEPVKAAIETPAPPAPSDLPARTGPVAPASLAMPMAVLEAPTRALRPVDSERSDILARVATFRARQARMNEEREAYYKTVQAKIRSELGNEVDSGLL